MIQPKTQVHPKSIVLFGTGLGTIAIGIYLLITSGVIGLFLILGGITITAAILEIEGSFTGTATSIGGVAPSKYRERRAKQRWDKERENQERGVEK